MNCTVETLKNSVQKKATGNYRTQTSRLGRKPILSPEPKQQIAGLVDQQPDIMERRYCWNQHKYK